MISKQKSRRVTVGGTRFRHKVSTTPKSKGVYELNLTAQSEDHNGSKLVVTGLIQKDSSVWPIAAGELEFYPTVTRHEAEWCIREAINHGWDYATPGANFVLEATNEIFRIGFWSTGRAKNPILEPNPESEDKANKSKQDDPYQRPC
ncbi:hypothetical protein [Haloferula sp.]|uniref:hypothetical protein n=1 Tax=Haloferula sp. TaxID=2497595 RepID=UPI00329ECCD1